MGIQKSNLNEQIIKNLLNKYYGIKIKEVETQVELMWKVQNGLGFSTVFNNKEEALKYAEDINNSVLERLGVENGKE